MAELWTFVALVGVTFFAAVVQSAAGFGFSLLSVPLFLILIGSLAAIQVAAIVNFVISLVLVPSLLRDSPKRMLLHLALGSIAGFPIGLWLYREAELDMVKLVLGILITAFTTLLIVRDLRSAPNNANGEGQTDDVLEPRPVAELGIGVISGIMSVALAMPGPAVVLYLAARQASKRIARPATLLLFLFSYGTVSLVHAIWGGLTNETWWLAVKLIPAVVAGAFCGHILTRYINESLFRKVVLIVLIGSGLSAIWAAL